MALFKKSQTLIPANINKFTVHVNHNTVTSATVAYLVPDDQMFDYWVPWRIAFLHGMEC